MKQPSWLEVVTGRKVHWWIERVETITRVHSTPREDGSGLGDTRIYEVHDALLDLVRAVVKEQQEITGEEIDGVMSVAAILSFVLAAWYKAVCVAKAYDTHRPVDVRKRLVQGSAWWTASILAELFDNSIFKGPWPNQEWDNPFKDDRRRLTKKVK